MQMARVKTLGLLLVLLSCGDNDDTGRFWKHPVLDGSVMEEESKPGHSPGESRSNSSGPLLDENQRPVVILEERELFSPAPAAAGAFPEELNWVRYFRYRLKTQSGQRRKPDAVLLFTPGLSCGANVYYFFGHELLKKAWLERGAWLELLVVERRPNLLEDTRGMERAEKVGAVEIARDYYFHGTEIDGGAFAGFLADEDVPYLSEFGLELALDDVYRVLQKEVPDPIERRNKVFVGGHSQAGTTTAYFAGWDFDGDPLTLDDAGYRNAAGYIALDCRVDVQGNGETSIADRLALGIDFPNLRQAVFALLLKRMRNGSGRVLMPLGENGLSREMVLVIELLAMNADFAPQEESSLLSDTPLSGGTRLVLRLLHSKNIANFVGIGPQITDIRYTNEALFGVIFDNNFMPFDGVKTAIGFLEGGRIVEKRFPYPEVVSKIPLMDSLFGRMMDADGLFIANDTGSFFRPKPLYTWRNFDEIGENKNDELRSPDGKQRFTSVAEEVTDLHDYTKLFYKGSSNFLEWYYTVRFLVDLIAAKEPFGPRFGLHYYHGKHTDDLPRITLIGGAGTASPGKTDHLGQNELHFLEGYNHIDLLIAAVSRPDIRENEVMGRVIDFVLKNKVD